MDRAIINYIKDTWDCITYARNVLAMPVYQDGDRCVSFRPDAQNPSSFVVYKDYWFDWGGNMSGDVIDLCAQARHNGDKGAAIRELASDNFIEYSANWARYTEDLDAKIFQWHSMLRQDDISYLHSRRISDDTIKRLRIGFDPHANRLTIPYWKNGHAAYFIARDRSGNPDAAKYKKQFVDTWNEHIPWGLHTLTTDFIQARQSTFIPDSSGRPVKFSDWLCILEGAFDALSFEQVGFHVLSPICGFFSKPQLNIVLAAAKNYPQVFICFDSDNAGNNFTRKAAEFCFKNRINFMCGVLPPGIKDVSDFYAAGGNIADLVSNASDGLAYLASSITDKQHFLTFLKSAARFRDKADLVDLCHLMTHFNKEWLNAALNDAVRKPAENIIIEEVKKLHEIKYIPDIGFFEYLHGVWVLTPDEFICQHIKKLLGNFATNALMSNICNHLKKDAAAREEFNKQPLFNFINGTLHLETGQLREHSTTDLSTVQAAYLYDQNAKCEKWRAFLSEIMENVPDKISLLQEAAGYILFSDCRFEKAFMLIGEGSNGKSVFINTLIAVFGKENCSNVSISDLASPFEPIRLQHSIANFSTEMKSSIKGTEDKFKQCVSGETITAAYKGKDAVTFCPRSKWIFSANSYIGSSDISYGFTRRICFVKFNRTFTGSEIDRDLTNKLRAELPGIFNWAYEGYKRLIKNGQFTETKEQQDMMADFMQAINPLVVFIDEWLADDEKYKTGELQLAKIYELYTVWAKSANTNPLNRMNFTRNFKTLLKQRRPDVVFSRSNSKWKFFFDPSYYTKGL